MTKEINAEKDWRKQKRKTSGSIKTVKGKLYARVQYIDEKTGKRKEKLRPANNKTHARALVDQMKKELETGGQTALEADKLTFSEVAETYQKINWLALWNIKKWTASDIVINELDIKPERNIMENKIFQQKVKYVYDEIQKLKVFDLPVRTGKANSKKSDILPEDYQ